MGGLLGVWKPSEDFRAEDQASAYPPVKPPMSMHKLLRQSRSRYFEPRSVCLLGALTIAETGMQGHFARVV